MGGYAGPHALPEVDRSGFGALHFELAELAHHVTPARVVETVDVEHPVQVVGLVLEDPRQETLRHDVERFAVEIGARQADPRGADRRVVRTRDRQASLLERLLALRFGEPGVRDEAGVSLAIVVDEARRSADPPGSRPDRRRAPRTSSRACRRRADGARRRTPRPARPSRGARGRRAFGSASRSRCSPPPTRVRRSQVRLGLDPGDDPRRREPAHLGAETGDAGRIERDQAYRRPTDVR